MAETHRKHRFSLPYHPRPSEPTHDQLLTAAADPVVAWGLYVGGVRQDVTDLDVAATRAGAGEGFVWLGLKDPSNEDMAGLAERFDLHPLAIEDAVEGHTRSKLEQFGDTLFCVISTIAYAELSESSATSQIVSTGQIMVFVGERFVMTVRRGDHAQLATLRARLELDSQRLALGTHEVLYSVLDKVIEDYLRLVDELGSEVENVEYAVFSQQGMREVDRVYQLKRELIAFKRAVIPLGAALHALATRPYVVVPERARAYFRELSDHHLEAREAVQSYDEVLSTILSAGLARISVSDNQDMRKISAFVAIVAIPTMIAGIYGMNFDVMPELSLRFGYFGVLGIMAVIMLGLYIGFRRNKWL